MNKSADQSRSLIGIVSALLSNFLLIRAVLQAVNRPRDAQLRSVLTVLLTGGLTIPPLIRGKRPAEGDDAPAAARCARHVPIHRHP
jgi:hypothetical protein